MDCIHVNFTVTTSEMYISNYPDPDIKMTIDIRTESTIIDVALSMAILLLLMLQEDLHV